MTNPRTGWEMHSLTIEKFRDRDLLYIPEIGQNNRIWHKLFPLFRSPQDLSTSYTILARILWGYE